MSDTPMFTIAGAVCGNSRQIGFLLESLIYQSTQDFEALLLISENSDRALDRCTQLAAQNPKVKTVPLPASAAKGEAWNYAIEHAAGKYLLFLDGSDWFEPDALKKFASLIENAGEPEVIFGTGEEIWMGKDGSYLKGAVLGALMPEDEGEIFSGSEALTRMIGRGELPLSCSGLWVCQTEFLRKNKLTFLPELALTDEEWMVRVLCKAQCCAALFDPFYSKRCAKGNPHNPGASDAAELFLARLRFWETKAIPEESETLWLKLWLIEFLHFFFDPSYEKLSSASERKLALAKVVKGKERKIFDRVLNKVFPSAFPVRWRLKLAALGVPRFAQRYLGGKLGMSPVLLEKEPPAPEVPPTQEKQEEPEKAVPPATEEQPPKKAD